jgi:signal transduction histidine kinase
MLVPDSLLFIRFTVLDFEVFSFFTIYFLIAITVDWFRDNIEKLQRKITENEQLHEQARHMEKLALAGEIAAGIAHEIRNPLTVVQGYIQLMGQKSREQNSEFGEIYALVLEEIRRSNQIISDFLRFSRPARPQRTLVQLNDLIEAASSLLFGEASQRNVHIYTYPDPELPDTCLDKDQLMQVLLNLFSNALQSMPGGGSLSVFTSFDRAANTLSVQISDSGIGIPADMLEKIFTPFFTTRENGTGLGLPITQSIVQAHRGQIKVESIPGQGTRFILIFPVVQDCAFAPEVG